MLIEKTTSLNTQRELTSSSILVTYCAPTMFYLRNLLLRWLCIKKAESSFWRLIFLPQASLISAAQCSPRGSIACSFISSHAIFLNNSFSRSYISVQARRYLMWSTYPEYNIVIKVSDCWSLRFFARNIASTPINIVFRACKVMLALELLWGLPDGNTRV